MTSSSKSGAPLPPGRLCENVALKPLPSLQALRERFTGFSLPERPSATTIAEAVNAHEELASRPMLSYLRIPAVTGTAAPHNTAIPGSVTDTASPSNRLRLPLSAFTRAASVESIRAVSGGLSRSTSARDRGQGRNTPSSQVPPPGVPPNVSSSVAGPAITLQTTGSAFSHSFDLQILPTPIRGTINTPTGANYVEGWRDIPTLTQIRDRVHPRAGGRSAVTDTATSEKRKGEVHLQGDCQQVEQYGQHEAICTSPEVETPIAKQQADRHPLQNRW